MNSETVPILGAVIIQSALGLTVFLANPRRKSNQCFLLLSFSAVGWLAALYFGSTTTNLNIVTWCIAWGRLRPNRFTVPASMSTRFGSLRPSLLWLSRAHAI